MRSNRSNLPSRSKANVKTEESRATKKLITVPPEFKKFLIEVVDPAQSTDYFELGGAVFPVQVLSLGLEKKFLRLATSAGDDEELVITRTVGELCHFYYPELRLDWPVHHANIDTMSDFYGKHLDKLTYNDEVIKVVDQVIDRIDWKPMDEKKKMEIDFYMPSHIFSPIFTYLNITEQSVIDLFKTVTRGMLEIIKLNNMLQNDRYRFSDPKFQENLVTNLTSQRMTKTDNLSEYLDGLMSQGFDSSGI